MNPLFTEAFEVNTTLTNCLSEAICMKGLDYNDNDGTFLSAINKYYFQGGAAGVGDALTYAAAKKMVDDYIATKDKNKDDNGSVMFGRESLLFLLSQGGCEGIRFYFGKDPKGLTTLLSVAVGAGGIDLNAGPVFLHRNNNPNAVPPGKFPLCIEVGNGKTINEFETEMQ